TEAVAVTAVTIAAHSLAVTPGGFGSYEAAATAALVILGVPAGPAFAIALTAHAVKTVYALAAGAVAVVTPAPSYLGRLRLPPPGPPRRGAAAGAAQRPGRRAGRPAPAGAGRGRAGGHRRGRRRLDEQVGGDRRRRGRARHRPA